MDTFSTGSLKSFACCLCVLNSSLLFCQHRLDKGLKSWKSGPFDKYCPDSGNLMKTHVIPSLAAFCCATARSQSLLQREHFGSIEWWSITVFLYTTSLGDWGDSLKVNVSLSFCPLSCFRSACAARALCVCLRACNQIFSTLLIFLSNSCSYLHKKLSLCPWNDWVYASTMWKQ